MDRNARGWRNLMSEKHRWRSQYRVTLGRRGNSRAETLADSLQEGRRRFDPRRAPVQRPRY